VAAPAAQAGQPGLVGRTARRSHRGPGAGPGDGPGRGCVVARAARAGGRGAVHDPPRTGRPAGTRGASQRGAGLSPAARRRRRAGRHRGHAARAVERGADPAATARRRPARRPVPRAAGDGARLARSAGTRDVGRFRRAGYRSVGGLEDEPGRGPRDPRIRRRGHGYRTSRSRGGLPRSAAWRAAGADPDPPRPTRRHRAVPALSRTGRPGRRGHRQRRPGPGAVPRATADGRGAGRLDRRAGGQRWRHGHLRLAQREPRPLRLRDLPTDGPVRRRGAGAGPRGATGP